MKASGSWLVSQSVENSVILKFHGNLLRVCRVSTWKLFWAYICLTNTAPLSSRKIEAGFVVILLCGPCLLLGCPNVKHRYPLGMWMSRHSRDFLKGVPTAVLNYQSRNLGGTAPRQWATLNILMAQNSKIVPRDKVIVETDISWHMDIYFKVLSPGA